MSSLARVVSPFSLASLLSGADDYSVNPSLAALCLEATSSAVAVISIIAGQRG